MRKKQIIALTACMILGIVGFTGVYLNEESEKKQQAKVVEDSQIEVEKGESSTVKPNQTAQKNDTVAKASEQNESQRSQDEKESMEMAQQNAPELAGESAVRPEDMEESVSVSQEATLHFAPEEGLTWPLDGNVIQNYSMDSTIYFETLDQYRYNPAVVIAGEVNSKVKLIADGKIKSISTNEEHGCTVVQDLGDGYEAIYGQLKEVNFKEGDLVKEGQVIGYVSEPTKYYSLEGSNLYFALEKDGEPVNPLDFFE